MTSRSALLVAVVLCLAACAEKSDPGRSATARAQASAPGQRRASSPLADSNSAFGPRLPEPTEAERAEIARVDPRADGWPSEVAAQAAERTLRALLAAFVAPGTPDGNVLSGLFAEDVERMDELRPEARSAVFEDDATQVVRADPLPADSPRPEAGGGLDPDALWRTGSRLREAAPHAEAFDVALEIVRAELSGDRLDADASVMLSAREQEARVQQNLSLRVAFAVDGLGPGQVETARVLSIELTRYEEIRMGRPAFAEVTRAVLGNPPFYEDELLRGVDDYFTRMDRLCAGDAQGMHGLAVGDFNGDGLDDLFVCQQGGLPSRLFQREPDGRARDVAPELGLDFLDGSRSALIADFDSDGDQDIAVAVLSDIVVAYNKDNRLERRLVLQGPTSEQIYSLSSADADQDGDLDLYACRYGTGGVMRVVPTPYHDAQNGASNLYWRNDGRGRWTEAAAEAGLDEDNHRFSLVSIWEDFDGDVDLDLYVVNDFGRNNLFRNDGSGRFQDVAAQAGAEDMAAGMGISCADFDLDGDIDFYTTNMFSAPGLRVAALGERFMPGARELHPHYLRHARGNTLLANQGDGTFADVTLSSGAAPARWAWGGKFADFNNDGFEDLYVPNGFITWRADGGDLNSFFWRRVVGQSPPSPPAPQAYVEAWGAITHLTQYRRRSWSARERNTAFLNLGGGRFADVSSAAGLDFIEDSRSVATVDWDDDGRLDLVLKSRQSPRLRILANDSPSENHFLAFELEGRACNRDAIGALVECKLEGRALRKRLYAGEGYLAQSSKRLHFGLGESTGRVSVSVLWPDGARSEFQDVEPDARYRIVQGAEELEVLPPSPSPAVGPAAGELQQPLHAENDRVVLAAKLPMAALSIPSFENPSRTVADFSGKVVLLHLWSARSEKCSSGLITLEHGAERIRAAGLRVVPLALDGGRELVRARGLASSRGFERDSGYLDGTSLLAIELAVLEVLGLFFDVPMPTSLLLDGTGQLAVMYIGELDLERVLADAEILSRMDSGTASCTQLSGGRWHVPLTRDLRHLGGALRRMGLPELSRFYLDLAGK
jgi:hypothetical protein